jgi:hypothetical protein
MLHQAAVVLHQAAVAVACHATALVSFVDRSVVLFVLLCYYIALLCSSLCSIALLTAWLTSLCYTCVL